MDEYYGLSDIVIVSGFFLMWNTAICLPTVKALSNLLHGECPATPILVCPHWIVGIALPIIFGRNSTLGSLGIFVSCLSFALPYTIGIYIELYDRWTSNDTQQRLWFAAGAARNANYMSLSQSDNAGGAAGAQGNIDLQKMNDQEREKYLDEVLLTRKVIAETKEHTRQNMENDYYDEIIYKQEKIDIKSPRTSRDNLCPSPTTAAEEEDEYEEYDCEDPLAPTSTPPPSPATKRTSSSTKTTITTKQSYARSEKLCSICLDEYIIGEEVCWSQNPDCYHAFHKSCMIAWLMKHKDCPVCRRLYIGPFKSDDVDDEETG